MWPISSNEDDGETFSLLGSPVTKENSELLLTRKKTEINQLAEKLKILPAHHAYKILQVSLGSPNLISILRSSPCHDINTLKKIDASLKENLEETLNITLTDEKWSQASLPIKFGGLGIRKPSDLAIPCYIASFLSAKSTNSKITNNSILEQYWAWYIDQTQKDVPAVRQSQKLLDENLIKIKFNRLRQNLTGTELSRITSASHKRAGDWLKAVPQMKLGVFLNNDEFRHAVSLRLGLPIFEKIDCVCGEEIDAFGHHCFVCNRNNGKILRHTMVNECVSRALKSAGLPNKMEPRYLAYDKGLRPDGVTQIPFQRGKCLTWDVSCPHPLCVSHIKCNNSSGKLSTICEELKQKKYSCLEENYIFSPIIIDTIGAYGSQTETTIKEIGARMRKKSGSLIATSQFRQRLSINLQKGNHLCFNFSLNLWTCFILFYYFHSFELFYLCCFTFVYSGQCCGIEGGLSRETQRNNLMFSCRGRMEWPHRGLLSLSFVFMFSLMNQSHLNPAPYRPLWLLVVSNL